MSNTQTTPATAANPDVAAATAQFLTPVVLGLQALAVNGKQAHWNVRGANFIAIHELLDSVVAHAQDGADEAAERIVALGLPIDARVATVAAKTASAVPAGFTQWDADAVHSTVAEFMSDAQTPRRLADLAVHCATDDGLRARLQGTVRNFLADLGRRTPIGKLVVLPRPG